MEAEVWVSGTPGCVFFPDQLAGRVPPGASDVDPFAPALTGARTGLANVDCTPDVVLGALIPTWSTRSSHDLICTSVPIPDRRQEVQLA